MVTSKDRGVNKWRNRAHREITQWEAEQKLGLHCEADVEESGRKNTDN